VETLDYCDKRLVYEIEFKEDSNGVNRPYVNGSSYVSDEEYPTLDGLRYTEIP
jgi:hypothetical protein